MSINHECALCSNPTDGYGCVRCTKTTAEQLQLVVDLAPEVETNVARLARYATRGGITARQPDAQEVAARSTVANQSNPVHAFAWAASREVPARGGMRATALPVDLGASERAAAAFGVVERIAQVVHTDRGEPMPAVHVGQHAAAVTAAWLIHRLDWLRHQPQAESAFRQLQSAGATIQRIVDRPADDELVGVCDCGVWLYVRKGAATVQCPCGQGWEVQAAKTSLMDELRDRRVTVAEGATLGVLAFPDLPRQRVRNLIQSWVRPDRVNQLIGMETPDGPLYSFGEILDRLSSHVLRFQGRGTAIVSMSAAGRY